MQAIVITEPGEPEVLQPREYAKPIAGAEEVVIAVKAAGINRADIAQRKGKYPAPAGVAPDIPGLEVAGVVEACGPGATMWQSGDKVCALLAGGGYAEYVSVKEGQCLPIPSGLSFAEAACLPETVFTVWLNVFERGALQAGETLLVHGGSSGIGTTAIQIAKALGASVVVTVGNDEKGKNCLALGADRFINYKTQDFEAVLKTPGVDVILDMVGGDYVPRNLNILKPDGRLVYINTTGGNQASVNIAQVMQKRLTITGSTLRSREYSFKKRLANEVLRHVWPLIAKGQVKPVIYRQFPFEEAALAHQVMEDSDHTGKLVLVRI